MKTRTILYADDGMMLTDGTTYGKQIYLAEGADADAFYEISDEEYSALMAAQMSEMLKTGELA